MSEFRMPVDFCVLQLPESFVAQRQQNKDSFTGEPFKPKAGGKSVLAEVEHTIECQMMCHAVVYVPYRPAARSIALTAVLIQALFIHRHSQNLRHFVQNQVHRGHERRAAQSRPDRGTRPAQTSSWCEEMTT